MKCIKCGREMTCTDDVNDIGTRLDFLNCECGMTATLFIGDKGKVTKAEFEYPKFKVVSNEVLKNYCKASVKLLFNQPNENKGMCDMITEVEWVIDDIETKQIKNLIDLQSLKKIDIDLANIIQLFKKRVRGEYLNGIKLDLYVDKGDLNHIIFTKMAKDVSERININS